MKVISNEWLKSAKSDLDTIEAILDNQSLTHIVAFHAQQCIEKCLKAVIEEHELPAGKIHNLITLKSIVSNRRPGLDAEWQTLSERCKRIRRTCC